MPPAIIGAAIVMGASYAAAIGAIPIVAAMVIATLATVAGSLLTKTPSFGSYKDQQERKQVLRAAAAPRTVVFGKTRTSGVLVFAEEQAGEQDENEWVHLVIVLAGHSLASVDQIWLGDDTIDTYSGYVHWEVHNSPTVAPPYLLKYAPSWKEDMIGKGISYLILSLKFDAEKFPSGIPNVQVLKRGSQVYDPRQDKTQWSDNAALCILHYYSVYLRVPDEDIDWESFKTAASICDELVLKPDGTREPRYTINGEFEVDEASTKVLEAMFEACSGEPTYFGGKHGMLAGAYYGPATFTLSESDIVGDVKIVAETSFKDKVNTITGKFVDPLQNYAEADFPQVQVAEWVTKDRRELKQDISYRFVTSEYQAQRLANITLRRKRLGRTIELPMNYRGYKMRPGRYVKLTLTQLGINDSEFRITKWTFSPSGGVTLTLRQETADVWGDAVGQPMDRPPLTVFPTGGIAAPDNLDYSVEVIGEVVQGILTWTNSGQLAYNNIAIYKGNDLQYTVQVPGQLVRLQGLVEGTYTAQVRAVSVMGAMSPPAAINFTIAVPLAPAAVEISASLWQITLRPKMNTSILQSSTTFEYFYWGVPLPINQVETTAILLGNGSFLVHDNLQPNTIYYYWIRGVNAYGKSSFMAIEAKTTSDPGAIIDAIAGSIGAEALTDELKKLIDDKATQLQLAAAEERLREADSQLQQQIDDIEVGTDLALKGVVEEARSVIDSSRSDLESVSKGVMENAFNTDVEKILQRDRYAVVVHTQETIQNDQMSMAKTVDGLLVGFDGQQSQIVDVKETIATEKQATAQRFENMQSSMETADGQLTAKIETLSTTVVNNQSSTTTRIDNLQSEFTTEIGKTNAAITTVDKTLTDATTALAQRVTGLDSKTADNAAAILTEAQTRATADTALAKSVTDLRVEMITADTTLQGNITNLSEVVATQEEVIAHQIGSLQANVESNANAGLENSLGQDENQTANRINFARIDTNLTVLANSDKALAESITKLEVGFDGNSASIVDLQRVVADNASSTATSITGIKSSVDENKAAINAESTARATADEALSTRIDTVSAKSDNNAALIATETTARTTADTALGTRIDTVTATTGDNKAAITAETTARTTADSALGTRIDGVLATTGANTAAITSEATTRASADNALGSRIDTVSATVGDNTAAIQQTTQVAVDTQGKFNAMWAVKAQMNDIVGGFGLVAETEAGVTKIKFVVDADVFAVLGRNAGVVNPFIIKNGIVYINHLLADNAEFGAIVAKYINVTSLNAALITSSIIQTSNMTASTITSSNWDSSGGAQGYGISADGWARFNEVEVRGYVTATSGTFNGDVYANNGWFRGTVYAERIEGDVVSSGVWDAINVVGVNGYNNRYFSGGLPYPCTVVVPYVTLSIISGSGGGEVFISVNGVQYWRASATTLYGTYRGSIVVDIPAYGTLDVQFGIQGAPSGTTWSSSILTGAGAPTGGAMAVMAFRKSTTRFTS